MKKLSFQSNRKLHLLPMAAFVVASYAPFALADNNHSTWNCSPQAGYRAAGITKVDNGEGKSQGHCPEHYEDHVNLNNYAVPPVTITPAASADTPVKCSRELFEKTKPELDRLKKVKKDGKDDSGRDEKGYDKDGKDKDGRGKDGFDKDGNDKDGRDKDGYKKESDGKYRDRDGYDKSGKDRDGHARSYSSSGGVERDSKGFDKDGHDKDGRDREGYKTDDEGHDRDRDGRTRDGYKKDSEGHDRDVEGFDRDGKDKHGKTKVEAEIDKTLKFLQDCNSTEDTGGAGGGAASGIKKRSQRQVFVR